MRNRLDRPNASAVPDTRRRLGEDYTLKDWDDLRLILALSRHGNFQAAARDLSTDQTTVSRRYKKLEQALGAKLFDRQGNRLSLTDAGQMIVERAQAMELLATEVNRTLGALDARANGTVKIAVTEGLGHLWLTPRLAQFCSLYPDIDVEVLPSHGEYDLVGREADVAIGYARPQQPRLVARRVGALPFGIYATENYLAGHPSVADAADLQGHDLVEYAPHNAIGPAADWMAIVRANNRVRFRSSSAAMVFTAIKSGIGVGIGPCFYERLFAGFVRLPSSGRIEADVWLVSHEETNGMRRIRVLLDFLTSAFEEDRRSWFTRSD